MSSGRNTPKPTAGLPQTSERTTPAQQPAPGDRQPETNAAGKQRDAVPMCTQGGGGSDAQGSATGGPCKCNCNYDGLHSELDKLKREVEEMKKLYKELFESLARKDKDVNAILKKSSAAK
nr:uncharacterized protein LOC107279186 isoform X2 [Oryza sativa Japonica Group]